MHTWRDRLSRVWPRLHAWLGGVFPRMEGRVAQRKPKLGGLTPSARLSKKPEAPRKPTMSDRLLLEQGKAVITTEEGRSLERTEDQLVDMLRKEILPPLNGTAAGARPTKIEPLAPPTTSLIFSVNAEPGTGHPPPISAGTKAPLPLSPTEYGTHAPAQAAGEISAICCSSEEPPALETPGAVGTIFVPLPLLPGAKARSVSVKVSRISALPSALDHTPSLMA